MQAIQITLNHLPIQADHGRSIGVCRSAPHLTRTAVSNGVHSFLIANEQFKSYASDLDMM